MQQDYQIENNETQSMWEAKLSADNTTVGYLTYEFHDDDIYFTHTVVKQEYQGNGIAAKLVRTALEHERNLGENKVVPVCSYVQGYIQKHPEYESILAD
ncbi:GNAT family N-acetyltransferase [Arcanobacterium hippocoleae]